MAHKIIDLPSHNTIVIQLDLDDFVVIYGMQLDRGDYAQTCAYLGQAVMHSLQCDGKIHH